ncbi:hypothetical protein [Clostridium algidicarnis]|uniref:hypothetical protein n=1 Tax=Clostridium algidicarnis TaxID=37659 RepID=UPI003FD6C843
MNKKDLAGDFSSKIFNRIGKLKDELYYVEDSDLDYIMDYVLALESLVEDTEL